MTFAPDVIFNPVAGLHENDADVPLAERGVPEPLQIAEGVGTETVGVGLTVTVTEVLAVQFPAPVPTTV